MLTLQGTSGTIDNIPRSIANARVDLNPHQVDAALLLVQHALRHRSIASTTIYARCDEGRLREVLAS